MSNKVKYNDYLKKSFIQYAIVILITIMLLIIGFFALYYYSSVIRQNDNTNKEITRLFENEYDEYKNKVEEIAKQKDIINIFEDNTNNTKRNISESLYSFLNKSTIKGYYLVINEDNETTLSNFNSFNQNIILESLFLRRTISRLNDIDNYDSYIDILPLSYEQDCIYSFAHNIKDNNDIKGYIFLFMRKTDLIEKIRLMNDEVIISDRYDNTIFSSFELPKDPGEKMPETRIKLDLEDRKINKVDDIKMYCRTSNLKEGIKIYTLTSVERISQMFKIAAVFFLSMSIIVLIFAYVLAKTYTRLNERTVSDHLSNLEIKNLEEQFNPHFVFNVMESVRFQIDEDPEKAQEMLMAFSTLMRYSINHGQTKVRLETDIDYLNDFLMLQKIRYNNLLLFDFEIPDELLDCLIPKLFLQPLVENSIRHGFVPGKALHIKISARHEDDDIVFEVSDDGKGIDEIKLKEIKDSFNEEVYDKTIQHIGLYNVEKVVNKLYGDKYHLDIHSEINKGTRVIIHVPYEQEEDDV